MIGCAAFSTPLTAVAVSHRHSPFLVVGSPVPFPRHAPPTLRLPLRRIFAGARAAYSSAAAERGSKYTTTDSAGGYHSSSYPHPISPAPTAAPSLYDALGLSPCATTTEIKTAYRRLARSCHPDAACNGNGVSASAEQFMRVHAAYATLSDPDKRAEYDRRLTMPVPDAGGRRAGQMHQRVRSYPAAAGSRGEPSSFGRRTWETDQCW